MSRYEIEIYVRRDGSLRRSDTTYRTCDSYSSSTYEVSKFISKMKWIRGLYLWYYKQIGAKITEI